MESKGKKIKWWLWAAVAASVALLAQQLGGDTLPEVETAQPQMGNIEQSASAYGRICPEKEVKISPDVSGEIVAVYFDEGDSVRTGDLLLKIKQETYLNNISRCEAALGSAQKTLLAQQAETALKKMEYERAKTLYDADASCLAQLETARVGWECADARTQECRYQIEAARASLDAARSELAKTMVYAPMSGIVTSLRARTGERVVGTGTMAGTEIMTIADLERMELVVDLGQNDICNVKPGDPAQIRPDAAPSENLLGHVSRIAVCANSGQTGSGSDFEVRISIAPQDRIKLLPGMSAAVTIFTGSKNGILTVPLQAVIVRDGQERVWVIGSDRRVHSTAIGCGIQDFNTVEVTGGLDGSELLVTGPYQTINSELNEDDKVKVRQK